MAEEEKTTKKPEKKDKPVLSDAARKKHIKELAGFVSMQELTDYVHPLKQEVKNALVREIADATDRIVGY